MPFYRALLKLQEQARTVLTEFLESRESVPAFFPGYKRTLYPTDYVLKHLRLNVFQVWKLMLCSRQCLLLGVVIRVGRISWNDYSPAREQLLIAHRRDLIQSLRSPKA